MLTLSRRQGERLVISDVVLTIEHVGDEVRIAVHAPREVDVVRGEMISVLSESAARADR